MTQQSPLSPIQNLTAIQRLTALWAFSESGLGGILHAWQMPFTGLIVGGFAVIIISIIAHYSRSHYKEILKSAVIVLVVKIVVSPHTPFPAYVAVSFQAIIGYLLFRFAGLNLFSILVFSIMAMFESALQQLLIFILFFGKSLWSAGNDLVESLFHQLGMQVPGQDHG